MSHPKTCRRLRSPYDDILANYPIFTALDWELWNPLSRRKGFLNEVDVTYSMNSAKCGILLAIYTNLLSNGWGYNITLAEQLSKSRKKFLANHVQTFIFSPVGQVFLQSKILPSEGGWLCHPLPPECEQASWLKCTMLFWRTKSRSTNEKTSSFNCS